MDKKEPQNCWEFLNCDIEIRKQCPAFISNSGGECWMVAGHYVTKMQKCQRVAKGTGTCFECPWFKKLNPDFDKK